MTNYFVAAQHVAVEKSGSLSPARGLSARRKLGEMLRRRPGTLWVQRDRVLVAAQHTRSLVTLSVAKGLSASAR